MNPVKLAAADLNSWTIHSPEIIARQERLLLVLAAAFVFLNRLGLLLAQQEAVTALWPLIIWGIVAVSMHLALNVLLPWRDPFITPITLLLSGWGLTLVARLAPAFATRQTIWLLLSAAAATAVGLLHPRLRLLRRYRYTWLLLGLVLLSLTLAFGVNPSGDIYAPQLWLGFGRVFFQPSEPLRLLLIIFLASYLADKREMIVSEQTKIGRWSVPALPYISPMLLMWGFCMILLVWQRDLGTASLFFLIFLAMLYVSTGQSGYVLGGLILLGVAGSIGYKLYGVVRLRVDTWLNPWPEASDRAFQIVQSLLAVAAGGLVGQGVGQGVPTYVPVVHSDFVFVAIAEEWGLVGTLGVVACLALLVLRALAIATQNSPHPFRCLLAAGIGISIGIQSLLIMAGTLKITPLTGVTLPFLSYGGSSLLSNFTMIGLLLRLSDSETLLRKLFSSDGQQPSGFAP
jgi:peptidoglycan glycosyltransferase